MVTAATHRGASYEGDAGPVIAVEGVTKRFGRIEVLKNVSLAINRGEIHAICGENGAGKSTLIKILTGVYHIDGGAVIVDGRGVDIRHPQQAQELGIALVAQELSLAPALSIFDNIWLGNRAVPLWRGHRGLRERAAHALEQVGLGHLPLDAPVSRLSIGQRQLVELARMLTRQARIFILDEPTATLSDAEIERIFTALRALKAEGKSVIYITHRLGEVFEICDAVSVLRNGELVGTSRTASIDRAGLMAMMLGRTMGEMYPDRQRRRGEPLLRVRHLAVPGAVQDFHLVAGRGTVVCLAGQVGSGATETLRALAGLVPQATGEVDVAGRRVALRSVPRAQAADVQFISEDRAGEGIFLRLGVGENLVATRLSEHARWGVLERSRLRRTARALATAVGIDRARMRSRAAELSGGNQQKLAFGRSIREGKAGVMLMNEPTRGVDVGARADIYRLIGRFCDAGHAVVMASSDLDEVLGMADVIVTLYRGRQVGCYRREEASMHRILADITHPAASP
jgi:ribose transport system ATP-binding protein/rhamnose transport system ATP-binding protein